MTLPRQSDACPSDSEPCAWCHGEGETSAIANFVLLRLRAGRDADWIGTSSEAMLRHAIAGTRPNAEHGPMDGWDLGRCMVTRDVAPPELHAAMDEIIDAWVARMERTKLDSGSPYYGVPDAREMRRKSTPKVRERIAKLNGAA